MQPSIRQFGEKLKSFIADDAFFYSVLLVLVGVVSFSLGQRSVVPPILNPASQAANLPLESPSGEINKLLVPLATTQEQSEELPTSELLVASRSGTRYHLETCPGAKQIIETNKITFNSATEARAAGYTPAANCPGLQ